MISLAETEGVWSESYVHISNHRGSWPQVTATAIYLDNTRTMTPLSECLRSNLHSIDNIPIARRHVTRQTPPFAPQNKFAVAVFYSLTMAKANNGYYATTFYSCQLPKSCSSVEYFVGPDQ